MIARLDLPANHAIEQHDALFVLIEMIRTNRANTRAELVSLSGLGRSVVAQRLDEGMSIGLIEETADGVSSGGRIPRSLRFRHEAGSFLVIEMARDLFRLWITDLNGAVLAASEMPWNSTSELEDELANALEAYAALAANVHTPPLWATVVGISSPVNLESGTPQSSVLGRWNGYDIAEFLEGKLGVPVQIENDVNLFALGEYSLLKGEDLGQANMIYLEASLGIGAAIFSNGQPHRGANGVAGDIGHVTVPGEEALVCICGQRGCLTAACGGWALARDLGMPYTEVLEQIAAGCRAALAALSSAAKTLGEAIGPFLDFMNPGLLVLGGDLACADSAFLASFREGVYGTASPAATKSLLIVQSDVQRREAIFGGVEAAQRVVFTKQAMNRRIARLLQRY